MPGLDDRSISEESTVISNLNNTQTSSAVYPDLFALDSDESSSSTTSSVTSDYSTLDACIDACSIATIVHGHKSKRRRTDILDKDLRPITFVRFNTSRGKMKPITKISACSKLGF